MISVTSGGNNDLNKVLIECNEFIRTRKKIEYLNVPCGFDIETTSFYENGEKRAIMYEWTLGINDHIFIGRTWDEFTETIDQISETLQLEKKRRIIIYVHNLAFEFQFMRKWFEWEKIFAVDERKPIYALTKTGIEFRCSYLLSGYSLETLGKTLRKYPVQKMTGDLDYKLLRHSETPLTDKELGYMINDVRVVMSYIRELIEKDGNIGLIPLTKTGYVRNYCRKACYYIPGNPKASKYKFNYYRKWMNALILDAEEYAQLKRAFQGGFTHANAFFSGKLIENVASYDFTSSYPAVMVAERFPMSRAEVVKIENKAQFEENIYLYCCLFDVEFLDLEAVTLCEHPLSASRCWDIVGETEDNGRIVEAEQLKTTLTEQDYFIIRRFYKWRKMRVGTFRRYKRGYLPTDFVKSILKLYKDKTELKNVIEREDEYMKSKEMINSCFGMCVTDICKDEQIYNGEEWETDPVDVRQAIEKNNTSKNRFLFYPWGVWVTAYARRNLFSGILEFGTDYIYSDTDSLKVRNYEKHKAYIERYNERIIKKLEKACDYHKIDYGMIRPKTIKGVEKPLGVWDFEGVYNRFKTLGAKRYMIEKPDALIIDAEKPSERRYDISLTVSGVNKNYAIPYLKALYGDNTKVFEAFNDGLEIPANATGKNTHTYIDEAMSGELTDYTGKTAHYAELSGVHLEEAEYSLSLGAKYIDFLKGIKDFNK